MKHVLALPFLLLAAATAGAVEVRSRPAEVTVYPQGALVVRRGEASLPAGQVTVSFPDLPASADESSVRLSVEGPRGTKFYGMTLKRAFTPEEAEVRIQLEKAGRDQAEPAKSVLAERIRTITALPCGDGEAVMAEYYGGWQERSWDLYAAAAAAFGGRVPGADEKARFFGAGK